MELKIFNTLETAILDWELGTVESILEQNPTISLNTTIHFARTVLHLAARANNVDIVRCLLKHGASPEITDTLWGDTPLHWAVSMGDSLDIVRALVEAVPNPEHRVRYLNHQNSFGQTALHRLTRKRERSTEGYGVTKYLIRAGADTTVLDTSGFSPAHYIAARGIPDALRALSEEAATTIYKKPGALAKGKTCLHLAATGVSGVSDDDNLDWLLDHFAPGHLNPNIIRDRDDTNRTAWEAAWDDTVSHRVDQIAAFVLKDARNGTINAMFDWVTHTLRSPKSTYYTLQCNNVSCSRTFCVGHR